MGLWRDIKAMDALLARASMREGSAAYEQPVSTGDAADHSHTSHVDALSSHEGVTVRTVAAHSCEWCVSTPVGVLHMDGKDGRR
jgi:hypothetical protein